ncbi:MAG: PEGA domain-containing protein [Pseudomonadota bacterium]
MLRDVRRLAVFLAAISLVFLAHASTATAQGAAGETGGDAGKLRVYAFPLIKGSGVKDTAFFRIQRDYLNVFRMSLRFRMMEDKDIQAEQDEKEVLVKRKEAGQQAPWLDEANGLLWKGMDHIEKKEYAKAIETLMQARQIYVEHYTDLQDYEKLVDSSFQLSIAFFMAGYKDNGEDLLKDVIVWRPTLVVDKKKYPKDFVASLDKLKNQLAKTETGTLRIEAAPGDGAKIYVDGLLKGTLGPGQTGVDVTDLMRGKHFVQVFKDGFQIWAMTTGVPAKGRTKKLVATLTPAEKKAGGMGEGMDRRAFEVYQYAQKGDYGHKFNQAAADFAGKSDIPYLLFGYVSMDGKGTKLTLFLFKEEWKATAEIEPVAFSADLANLSVYLLYLEANLDTALRTFPKDRVVQDVPAVYLIKEPEAVAPVVVKKEEPVPVVDPVKTEPEITKTEPRIEKKEPTHVVVVRPEKKVEPVRVTPDRVEKTPVLTSRTDGITKKEDYGELSSIFATEEELGLTGTTDIVQPPPRKKDGLSKPIHKQWWFWTGVGVVAASAIGVGGYFLGESLGGGGTSGYTATVNW